MIDPSLIKEFAIGGTILSQSQNGSSKKEKESHIEDTVKIRDIRVDQNWVERAKMFVDYFFQIVSVEEVDRQFSRSEFDDFQLFLNLNSLHYFEDHYIKVKTETEILKQVIVDNCYENAKILDPEMTLDGFLDMQGILTSYGTYLRVKTQFPKTKLLEILTKLKLAEMSDSEGLLTVDLLDQLFQSKETSLKMILACYLANLGAMMTVDGQVLIAETRNQGKRLTTTVIGDYWQSKLTFSSPHRAMSLANCPIGLILNREYLKILEEWTQMTVGHLVDSASKSKQQTLN